MLFRSAGYMKRSMHLLPRQSDREPWLNTQDYARDVKLIRKTTIDDGVMTFDAPDQSGSARAVQVVAGG